MLYKKFQNLILDKKISTDEPPLSVVDHGVRFIRPMFYCVEKKVKEYVFPDEYDYVKSECEFIIRKNKILTSREYIQQNILNDTLNEEVYNCLISLICNGLKSNGEVVYDVRRNRDFILGKEYKNDGICQKL